MSNTRGGYSSLSNFAGSNDGLIASAPGNDTAETFNLQPLNPRRFSGSTPSLPSRSDSRPRRSSPLSGQQLIQDDTPRTYSMPDDRPRTYVAEDTQRRDPSSSRDPFIPELNPDRASLEVDDRHLRLQHDFDSKKQFWKMFTKGLVRFLFTLIAAVLLVLVIFLFSRKNVISSNRKKWFNAINTGLSLALGMSIAHGFRAMAIDIRWWILSRRTRSLSEVDKIMRSESLTVALELLFSSFGRRQRYNPFRWRWKLFAACLFWLVINLAAQVAVALVGLNYSADVNDNFALCLPGNVSIPDMSQIYPVGFDGHSQNSVGAQQYTANSYGNMALVFENDFSSNIPEAKKLWSTGANYFLADDGQSWIYVFLDSAPLPLGTKGTSVYTNRTINSTWSCQSWPVIQGGNGTVTNLTVLQDANGGPALNVTLPFVGGTEQTTFLTTPNVTCGTGCSVVEAFEASLIQPWYYKCNITVGKVMNATLPQHDVGPSLRNMASAAIALQGYGLKSSTPGGTQYQVYPSESTYGQPQGGYNNGMGSLMARFSIGVVTAAAMSSNQSLWFKVPGQQPQIGNQLNVSSGTGWLFIYLILGLLVGTQGVGFVVTAFWANRVLVKDESIFSTATLLRTVLHHLQGSGNAANGEVICDVLGHGRETMVVYTAIKDGRNVYHLELGSNPRHRAFPEGTYV